MYHEEQQRKGASGLLALVLVLGVFGYFGYDTLMRSKLVTDENGVTSQEGGIKLGLDLAGGVSITYQAKEADPESRGHGRYPAISCSREYRRTALRRRFTRKAATVSTWISRALPTPIRSWRSWESQAPYSSMDENMAMWSERERMWPQHSPVIYKDETGANKYEVSLTFTEEGTKKFADVTAANVGKHIAIVYDGMIYSNPVVQAAITGGKASISGMSSYEEADKLASTIRIGSLSLELEELRSNVVGAKLGQEAISTSLKAGVIGFGIVCVFMIIVYLIPGLAASLALCLYVALIIILLAAFEVTLTLPGIAGIILSIGMAVDANVIIFTRIKEEIGLGKTVKSAIKTGFAKALSAIIDGNVTTLIAAAVLYWRGSGTVKGFATTLAIGIVLSMFTALFVTKFVLNALYDLGFTDKKFYGTKKEKKAINFLGKRNVCFIISSSDDRRRRGRNADEQVLHRRRLQLRPGLQGRYVHQRDLQ